MANPAKGTRFFGQAFAAGEKLGEKLSAPYQVFHMRAAMWSCRNLIPGESIELEAEELRLVRVERDSEDVAGVRVGLGKDLGIPFSQVGGGRCCPLRPHPLAGVRAAPMLPALP